MTRSILLSSATLFTLTATVSAATQVYIGTYTSSDSKGIYRSILNTESGELSEPVLAAEVPNPSFVAIHPSGDFIYAVSEIADFEGKKAGAVSGFAIEKSGALKLINQRSTGGDGSCHLSFDSPGQCLLVANYGGGSVISYPLDSEGRIGPAGTFIQHEGSSVNPQRQKGPHAHSVNVDPTGQRAFVADLGLDKILIYKVDGPSGTITPNNPPFLKLPDGGGPRHLSFHPSGKFAYTNLEMTLQIAALSHDAKNGTLKVLEIQPTAEDGTPHKGNSTAETLVHPSGKWVYVSNRGPNCITAFRIDQETGKLTFIERESTQGNIPRGFGIDPSGNFLIAANQKTDNVVVFRINQRTGELDPTGHSIGVPIPVNVRFLKQ